MSRPKSIQFECPTCHEETTVDVWPIFPAVTWGPSDNWHDTEGGEFEPEECPKCLEPFDAGAVHEKAQRQEPEL